MVQGRRDQVAFARAADPADGVFVREDGLQQDVFFVSVGLPVVGLGVQPRVGALFAHHLLDRAVHVGAPVEAADLREAEL